MHMIVECDTNTVHCSLLEFLIRLAFAWRYQRLEATPKTDKAAMVIARLQAGQAWTSQEQTGDEFDFAELLFEEKVF